MGTTLTPWFVPHWVRLLPPHTASHIYAPLIRITRVSILRMHGEVRHPCLLFCIYLCLQGCGGPRVIGFQTQFSLCHIYALSHFHQHPDQAFSVAVPTPGTLGAKVPCPPSPFTVQIIRRTTPSIFLESRYLLNFTLLIWVVVHPLVRMLGAPLLE